MNVVLISHSDTVGGAAVVSLRLIHALLGAGVTARMLVVDRRDIDVYAQPAGSMVRNKWNFQAERMGIFMNNGMNRGTLFKIDTCTHGLNFAKHEWVQEADVVMLGWVNQGTLSLRGIQQIADLGKPIVWVMHDMWNCTGVCHHAYDCEKYMSTCQSCPLTGKRGCDLSTKTQQRKARLYSEAAIHFVAVSHWLARVCRKSALLRSQDIRVIPNTLKTDEYQFERLGDGYEGIPAHKKVVVVGARRLDEPGKGGAELVAAMQWVAEHKPALARQLHLVLYGDLRDRSLLGKIAIPVTYLGQVSACRLNEVYRRADIVLSTSEFESFGATLIEGQASGCIPVARGGDGRDDIIDHLRNGYLARNGSAQSIADGLEWAASQPVSREFLHGEVDGKFSYRIVAQQFIELFNEILSQRSSRLNTT